MEGNTIARSQFTIIYNQDREGNILLDATLGILINFQVRVVFQTKLRYASLLDRNRLSVPRSKAIDYEKKSLGGDSRGV